MILTLAAAVALLHVGGAISHPATDAAVVYFTIRNDGPADALVGAETALARSATIHKSSATQPANAGGMPGMSGMSAEMMLPVQRVDVPANGTVAFAPGGYHIMLEGLKAPLEAGTSFTLRLHFTNAGWIAVQVRVESY